MTVTHNPFFKLKLIDLSDDTQVNSGGGINTQTLQPAAGFCYQIVKIFVDIPDPVGSAANDHRLYVGNTTNLDNNAFFSIVSGTGTDITINEYGLGGTTEVPANIAQQQELIYFLLYCNHDNPIEFLYINNTDVNQTGTRTIKVLVKEYKEGV